MTSTEVLFDTWAWWEVLWSTDVGRRLQRRYLAPGSRVNTSVLSLAEVGAKLNSLGHPDRVASAIASVRARSYLHSVDAALAEAAGPLRSELRRSNRDAGLVDAIILATARRLGAKIVSRDGAFGTGPDVVGL